MPVFRALTRPIIQTPEQGADTIVWLRSACRNTLTEAVAPSPVTSRKAA